MKRTAWLALALVVSGLQAGCVTRRVMITSEPPGAVVYRNGQPIGATPVEESFIYYGRYHYRFVKDGYQPLDVYPDFIAPWYEYPGIDFVFENLLPFTFRDVQQVHVKLSVVQPVRTEDVKAAAAALRGRGQLIQRPPDAPPPPIRRQPQPTPVPPLANVPVAPVVPPNTVPAAPAGLNPSPAGPSRQGP